ncbi:hypothetical protein GQX74_013639 [Glossina fuscipes]|nr:hypothetical protein GQX74_013639 [Glossina fuscipes]
MPFNSKNKEKANVLEHNNSEREAYDFRKKEALDTLTVQLCNMSDTKYKRAIFFEANVDGLPNDSATHSHISSAASACSMQNIIASPILDRSGVKCRIRSSKRSRCLQIPYYIYIMNCGFCIEFITYAVDNAPLWTSGASGSTTSSSDIPCVPVISNYAANLIG